MKDVRSLLESTSCEKKIDPDQWNHVICPSRGREGTETYVIDET
jgi:hypothetical protein